MTLKEKLGFALGWTVVAVIAWFGTLGIWTVMSNPVRTETVHVQPSADDILELLKSSGEPCEAPQAGVACAQLTDGKTFQAQIVYVP